MATSTWSADGAHGNLASTAANWDTPPAAGSDVVFNATSVVNCTWDLAIALATFSMSAGYTGTVTQAASFSTTGDLAIAAGLFVGDITMTVTVAGTANVTNGKITNYLTTFIMTGNNKYFHSLGGYVYLYSFQVAGSSGMVISDGSIAVVGGAVTVAAGKNWEVAQLFYVIGASVALFNNAGLTSGNGILNFRPTTGNCVFASAGIFGNPVKFWLSAGEGIGSTTITLASAFTGTNTLTVMSDHATSTVTLDASASNYPITWTSIVISTKGIINGRAARIACTTLTESGAASVFTQGGFLIVAGTASISDGAWAVNENATADIISQTGGTITVAAGKVLYYEKTLTQSGGSSSGTIAQFQARKQPPNQPARTSSADVTHL